LTTRDSTRSVQLWGISPGVNVPLFDLNKRYATFASASVEYTRKSKEGVFYGAWFDAFYGTSVRNTDQMFSGLTDEDGNFMGVNGEFAILQPGLTGGQIGIQVGSLVAPRYNPNSGWVFMQGISLGQTKIGMRDQRSNLPQLQSPFLEGYDRLHRGIYIRSAIKYLHLDNQERINYSIGLTLNLGVSQSVRGFNIDTMMEDSGLKFEGILSANFSWYLPIYAKQESFYLID
jgi:hypothetical protein